MVSDARQRGLCVLVPLAALSVAWPFAEGGCIDDFSYAHMAKTLAQTGRFAYNGWPTAMLGVQIWWAAVWIRLFGFSFTLVRLCVLPLAIGSIVLVYALARRARLSADDSLFIAVLTALSTLFLPVAPTFMSDLPAFFFLVASLLGFVRAADAHERDPASVGKTLGWMALGAGCGLLGGTIRQTVWFAPVACGTVMALRRRGAPLVRVAATGAALAGMTAIVVGTRWFRDQPYAIPTQVPRVETLLSFEEVGTILLGATTIVAECLQKLLPALLFCMPAVMGNVRVAMGRPWGRRLASGTAAAAVIVLVGTVSGRMESVLLFLGGGWRPTGRLVEDCCVGMIRAGVLVVSVAAGAAALVAVRRKTRGDTESVPLPPAVVLPLAALVPYVMSLLVVSRTTAGVYPRYYLPILPACATWLLYVTRRGSPAANGGRSVLGWLLVAFFGLRGIAIVHDEFADTRARLAAIAHLESRGVPRHRIASKWVIDGWVQIERAGFMNDSRIRVPADAYRADVAWPYPDEKFRDKLPVIEAEYIVADSRERLPGDTAAFPRFPYTSWRRPPYRREMVIRGPIAP